MFKSQALQASTLESNFDNHWTFLSADPRSVLNINSCRLVVSNFERKGDYWFCDFEEKRRMSGIRLLNFTQCSAINLPSSCPLSQIRPRQVQRYYSMPKGHRTTAKPPLHIRVGVNFRISDFKTTKMAHWAQRTRIARTSLWLRYERRTNDGRNRYGKYPAIKSYCSQLRLPYILYLTNHSLRSSCAWSLPLGIQTYCRGHNSTLMVHFDYTNNCYCP